MPTVTNDGFYYVDLGPDPLFGTGSFVSVYPEGCTFDHMIRGVGNISFQLSFSATDQDGNPSVGPPVNVGTIPNPSWVPVYGPYRTYWRLRYGDTAILAGVITNTSSVKGSDFMSLSGKTWEHFFEKWMYPDDARPTHINDFRFSNTYTGNEYPTGAGGATPTGLVYEALNRDLIRILRDLITQAAGLAYRVPIDITGLGGLSGISALYYTFSLGDTSTFDQIISTLADIDMGFDWWISQDMKLLWGSPYRYGNPSAPFLFDTITDTTPGVDVTFNNNGPVATHIIGSGAGFATDTTLRRGYGSIANEQAFSRFDAAHDFGDIRDANTLVQRTLKQLDLDLQPQHEIPLILNPSQFTNFWANYRTGRAIGMTLDFFYHRVIRPQQLVSYQATLTEEREATVTFTIQQIYDINMSGTPEG